MRQARSAAAGSSRSMVSETTSLSFHGIPPEGVVKETRRAIAGTPLSIRGKSRRWMRSAPDHLLLGNYTPAPRTSLCQPVTSRCSKFVAIPQRIVRPCRRWRSATAPRWRRERSGRGPSWTREHATVWNRSGRCSTASSRTDLAAACNSAPDSGPVPDRSGGMNRSAGGTNILCGNSDLGSPVNAVPEFESEFNGEIIRINDNIG